MRLQVDLQFFAGEKTEKATPKKRQDVRKKGQVTKSQDVNTAILLFFVFVMLLVIGEYLRYTLTSIYSKSFTEYIHQPVTNQNIYDMFFDYTWQIAKAISPIMAVAIVAGIGSNLLQFGFLFSGDPLKPKLNKIDPLQGAKRIFSARALVEMVKSLLKISLTGAITFAIIWMNRGEMLDLTTKGIDGSLAFFSDMTMQMGFAASIALLIISVIDYTYQRYDFEKQNRMSKNDVKDEHKNIEGDPQIKSKMKDRQRQMATQRMMSEVPEADVIITNPTHYAIAIKYDEAQAEAPYVVAKGVDYVAVRIKDVAKNYQVIMVEDRPLARALYDQVEIGEAISEEFYQAVAEILAYVYRLQKKV
ncbi:flagellar biosynthesis protein FlhB [Gracilibacillus halophilus YIM-C55.5]|uniref:Flagellar biosynthetic protein FlhB n=1 Tax=Gracilibacillus halophilus YIM-C55.5 TaxID=1308866 RepID=N4WD56_9BACI|nr:flagellar biosynthesis protein FlhB [Gracilibacillus halophilus]ENH98223.1 flagellar biosynthesis protein FlhB [Gracilibacillus halophilus YIM-C55.5]